MTCFTLTYVEKCRGACRSFNSCRNLKHIKPSCLDFHNVLAHIVDEVCIRTVPGEKESMALGSSVCLHGPEEFNILGTAVLFIKKCKIPTFTNSVKCFNIYKSVTKFCTWFPELSWFWWSFSWGHSFNCL